MANKKVSQLVSKPSVLVTDLFPIADPTTGQLYKTTISDLGTAIGSGVSSVNGLVGAVVLDTDDIQELASPTNRWFTDTRARAALSAASPLAYNSGTGVFSIPQANGSTNGFLSSADWTTFNAKQAALSGTGFVKISGTTISYDNSTYLTTSGAASTYLALSGGTLTGALNGTSATFTGDVTLSATNPRLYFTDTDNNPDYFISNTDGTFTIYDVTNSTSRFTIGTTGNVNFTNAVTSAGTITGSALIATTTVNAGNSASFGGNLGTGGVLNLFKSNGRTIAGSGYTSIYADSSILGIVDTTGSNAKEINFSLASVTNSTLRTYTLPDASGTIALTSNLSAYLPLAGGTLTGALFATSASFSGFVGFGGNTSPLAAIDVTGAGRFSSTITASGATFSGDVTINNGLADGGQLVLASSGFSNWNIDNFSGRFRAYYGSTEYFTINASGNVGIGTTGNASRTLEVAQPSGYSAGIRIIGNTGGDAKIQFLASGASSQPDIGPTTASPNDLIFGTGGGEKMRITSSGNVGIGTTAPGSALEVARASGTASYVAITSASTSLLVGVDASAMPRLFVGSADPITFWTNSTERMRITGGGAVYINQTANDSAAGGAFFQLTQGNGNWIHQIRNSNTSGGVFGSNIVFSQAPNNSSSAFFSGSDSSAERYRMYANGGLANYQANNVNLSDARTKKDIIPLESYWNKFKAIEMVKFKYKDQTHEDFNIGVIAQQVESVAPEFVDVDGWGETKEGETPLKSIYTADLYHASIGVLKEAMAKIETLEAKIATLENK